MARPGSISLVYYHVPTDGDECGFPNAFPIPKPAGQVKMRDIREKFPLPGNYHFRFKLKWSDSTSVWMDVTNEDSPVPTYDEKIICKVLRLSWAGDDAASGGAGRFESAKTYSNVQQHNLATNNGPVNNGNRSTGAAAGGGAPAASAPKKMAANTDLFSFDSPSEQPAPPADNGDLLFDFAPKKNTMDLDNLF